MASRLGRKQASSKNYPTLDEFLMARGFSQGPGGDDGSGWSGEGDLDAATQEWESQYDTPYANWMRMVETNPELAKAIGGSAGLVAPGYYPGYVGGLQGKTYNSDEMFGRHGPMGNSKFLKRNRNGARGGSLTPEQLAARAEFESLFPGYGQLTPDQVTVGPDGRVRIKTAGPSAGQYVADPSKIKYDERYGSLVPLDALGASGGKGGWADTFKDFAPLIALATLGSTLMAPPAAGAVAGGEAASSALGLKAGGGLGFVPGAGGIGLVPPAGGASMLAPGLSAAGGAAAGSLIASDFTPGTFDGPGSAVVGDTAGIAPSSGVPSGLPKAPPGSASLGKKILDKGRDAAISTGISSVASSLIGDGGEGALQDSIYQMTADEQRKKGLRDQLNSFFSPEAIAAEEADLTGALSSYYGDELKRNYERTERENRFNAADRGQIGGSVYAESLAELEEGNRRGGMEIGDAVQRAVNNMRQNRDALKTQGYSMIEAGIGEDAVNSAASQMRGQLDNAKSAGKEQLFTDIFSDVAFAKSAGDMNARNAMLAAYGQQARNRGALKAPVPTNDPRVWR